MAIAVVNPAQATADSTVTSVTVSVPAGTLVGHMMIAAMAIRPDTEIVTDPAGWTRWERMNGLVATLHSQIIYYKRAGANEPANYVWTLAATQAGCVVGIITFSGVNNSTPIINKAHQFNAASKTQASVDMLTIVPNTMLVTIHSIANKGTWSPPGAIGGDAAMTERVDGTPAGVGNIMMEMATVPHDAAAQTGAKTATDDGIDAADVGIVTILALSPWDDRGVQSNLSIAGNLAGPIQPNLRW